MLRVDAAYGRTVTNRHRNVPNLGSKWKVFTFRQSDQVDQARAAFRMAEGQMQITCEGKFEKQDIVAGMSYGKYCTVGF
jgi:hypothetical protein